MIGLAGVIIRLQIGLGVDMADLITATVQVRDIDRGFRQIIESIGDLSGAVGTVGLHDDTGSYPDGKSVVEVGFMQEFGASGVKFKDEGLIDIPSRPFMRGTFDTKKREWINKIKIGTRRYVASGGTDPKAFLGGIGFILQADIQNAIFDIKLPPNSPRTLRHKKGSNPLIDTGRMRSSISHKEKVGDK